jgi:hypothetical protein
MPPSRNDIETTSACPVCAAAFTPIRRQRYCTPACRQAAWRARHPDPRPADVVPATTHRRSITIYQCPACDTRQLGQQRRHDCPRPCTRVDLGGLSAPLRRTRHDQRHPRPAPHTPLTSANTIA